MKINIKLPIILLLTLTFFFYLPSTILVLGLPQNQFIVFASAVPNDPDLTEQYYFKQIDALAAWAIVNKSPKVIVAVIDTGVDIYHPDLAPNIWLNQKEIKGDGIDNDQNGYLDDYQGWDFILNSPDPRPKFGGKFSSLGINHGTVLAGIIGAVGNNNVGITGLAWQIQIMPLRALNSEGVGDIESVIKAIQYATMMGADVINLSIVGSNPNPLLKEAISQAYQKGIIIVVAAGNESADSLVEDLDFLPRYPVCHDGDNNHVLGVGSVDFDDLKSSFSNYGFNCLDLMAPGEFFYSTRVFEPIFPEYQSYFGGYWSGTSVATSLVSATAALVKALRPELTNREIYNLIIDNTDSIDNKNPFYLGQLGSGRLNVLKTLEAAKKYVVSSQGLVLASQSNHRPLVKVTNKNGQIIKEFLAYNENFLGGVNLTSVDLNGDGSEEIITGAGVGGGPHIRVFSRQGELLRQFFAYEQTFTGGVNVAAADIDNDGEVEIITAPQSAYQPLVRIYGPNNEIEKEFLAFELSYFNGVNLALSDINGDEQLEIVTTPNQGRAPQIKIFNEQGLLIHQFLAYSGSFTGGVKVSAADLFGDKRTEFITVPAADYQPLVKIFSASGNIEYEWLAFLESEKTGLNITTGNLDDDSELEVVISQAQGTQSQVKVFDYFGNLESQFTPFGPGYNGGVNLAL